MRALGLERFAACGHDRGARVGYRMALDHPERVERLAVIDIVPTGEAIARANREFGVGYWHWFFLARPAPLPERLIAADPDAYYTHFDADFFDPEASRRTGATARTRRRSTPCARTTAPR